MENNIPKSIQCIWIPSYTFWTDKRSRHYTKIHERHHEGIFRLVLYHLYRRHPDILQQQKGIPGTSPKGPGQVEESWIVCKTREMRIFGRKNHLLRVHNICRWYRNGFYKGQSYPQLGSPQMCQECAIFLGICKFLSMLHLQVFGDVSTNIQVAVTGYSLTDIGWYLLKNRPCTLLLLQLYLFR